MTNFSITSLAQEFRESVIELFIEAFFDNHFYIDMFPDSSTRKEKLRSLIEINIDYIINDHKSYCVLVANKVVGFLLNIDYFKLAEDPKALALMFSGSTDSTANLYYNEIDVPVSVLPNALYMLNCAVHPDYRQKGFSKRLLDKALIDFKDMYIVADVANPNLLKTFQNKGFKITEIDTDYWLCILPPKIERS